MSLISVKNLTFGYDGSIGNVFEDVSFQIDTDWKLGFVGRNGRGKTTFLNLLMGKYDYLGKIYSSVDFTYFPFEVKDGGKKVKEVMLEVCPIAEEWEIIREFSYLNMDDEISERIFDSLSGGERTNVLLAGLFLRNNNFLLIDEPTNHLDSKSREVVSEYLAKKKGFILVSHDRTFLDRCTDHILSINRKSIEVVTGNFSIWLDNFNKRMAYEEGLNNRLQKDIAKMSEAIGRTKNWADKTESSKYGKASSGLKQDKGYVGHKSAKMMKRAKAIEERQRLAIEQKLNLLHDIESTEDIKICPLDYHSEKLLDCSALTIYREGKRICGPIDFQLMRGERIALTGGNGSGKSSVIKLIAGEDIAHSGTVNLASGVIVSYVPQIADNLYGTFSQFVSRYKLDMPLFRGTLVKLGFEGKDFEGKKDIESYSLGQKKKILLAKSLCERAHLYLWDEPFNYLDIYARMQIEDAVKKYNLTMVFVEHDIAFRNSVADKVISLT